MFLYRGAFKAFYYLYQVTLYVSILVKIIYTTLICMPFVKTCVQTHSLNMCNCEARRHIIVNISIQPLLGTKLIINGVRMMMASDKQLLQCRF